MGPSEENFAFIVEDGFTMQAFSSAIEVLRVAQKLGAGNSTSYCVASLDDGPVAASNGIEILPTCEIDRLPINATRVIVAGAGAARRANSEMIKRLRRWARAGQSIWAISSGVVRLAQAGLIDGRTVCAHWEDVPYLKENHPKVDVSTSLFIMDTKHSTCSGGGAAADLMLKYVHDNCPDGMVEDIASCLMMEGVRDGKLKQTYPAQLRYVTANRQVFAAIQLMEANRFDALSLFEIARRSGVSQRQLERLFQSEFQKTPGAIYKELRMSEARQEVLMGRRSIADIALDFGFEPAQFSKVYRKVFGVLPSADRR
ncbi:helix-turn-helix domain-containing protein [Octadecabacter sp. G9-8]|uniref:Helix-turn-helix domain-containing protein n=1 Tax=Octadecabacter dasysiphoniae TaxID=2909341 RepID=A0ABS9D075_9RHOB|nr:helix-turn-helix domain-containing protein [Octadecabacter dasysiphoniae]MCF2872009.1 helix-turn-helix domain-containing protein [Octadecabacter dasysiphoniae]